MEQFEQWITKELEARGWSQSEAARRSGISASMFSQVLSKVSKPGPDFLIGVARAFGITKREAFERAGIIEPSPPTDEPALRQVNEAFAYLSQEERKVWLDMLMSYAADKRRGLETSPSNNRA